ncbi:hypothetical protein [endosymbiont GvMRE of Glomus versiforme]|uniref:hypothetical protein n=1 Tax=endosymbiont GvMRE of Glomus versiforme TaxID=2039283 RepID=UPI000ECB1CC0|nr:hypothetical protein [endosymbiont GvMRE of Glomus versiforme]RHZ36139.1 hypothetical protein GvMRE_Ic2g124 [endosymbiont GvMRE of Glomus versiforme]
MNRVIRMRLWQYPHVKATEFPEGYQLSWIVFKLINKRERVLFDNHVGKPPHYHDNEKEVFFTWKSLLETEKCFSKWFIKNLVILIMSSYE